MLPKAEPEEAPITDDARLGISSAQSLGIVRRYQCGCALVRVGRGRSCREVEQLALTCPGGDEHRRPLDDSEAEQGTLF